VDGSSTGTSVPWMWALLMLPRFRGASHADDNDNRLRHRQVGFPGSRRRFMRLAGEVDRFADCSFSQTGRPFFFCRTVARSAGGRGIGPNSAASANKFWSAGRNRPKTSFTGATFSGPAEQGHPDCDLFARYSSASLICNRKNNCACAIQIHKPEFS
jgi:hypothetical protein